MGISEVARVGRVFRGVIITSESGDLPGPPVMHVAVAQMLHGSGNGDKNVITPSCYSLRELRREVDKLKADLDWVYQQVERQLRSRGYPSCE